VVPDLIRKILALEDAAAPLCCHLFSPESREFTLDVRPQSVAFL
jgi:hypothetical protein